MESKENNIEKKFQGTQRESVITETKDGYALCTNGKYEFVVVFGKTLQAKQDIKLFADALNTIQKCDLMPSQLLSKYENQSLQVGDLIYDKAHLLAHLKRMQSFKNICIPDYIDIKSEHMDEYSALSTWFQEANELIKKIEG